MRASGLSAGTACVLAMLLATGAAVADSATMVVGTANGTNEFSIVDGGNELHYNPQPDTEYNWYYADGGMVMYTYNGATAPRDGMKTFAATNVAYGQRLDSLSLEFDYAYGGTDAYGLPYKGYPSINVHITDGAGNFAIWSATSGGTVFTATYPTANPDREGWYHLTMDLTNLVDNSVYGKINESTNENISEGGLLNGKLNQTSMMWSDIKDWKIAGFYTEQFSPTGGLGAWNETLWDTVSMPDAGDGVFADTNQYGVSLVWGDTVGGMYGDGEGEIGPDAERAYAQGSKAIANVVVGVDGVNYDMSFEAGAVPAPVPEPATMIAVCAGLAGLGRYVRRRIA